jgi:hypothetical protein
VCGCGLDSSGSEQRPAANSCEHGNEPSGFIKGEEFLDWVSDHLLLKNLATDRYTRTTLTSFSTTPLSVNSLTALDVPVSVTMATTPEHPSLLKVNWVAR